MSTLSEHSKLPWSPEVTNLMLGTAAKESQRGFYWKQLGKGPALGIFQMEPNTEKDIWENYIRYKPDLKEYLASLNLLCPDPERLKYDLRYQILMCRIHYLRVKEPIPVTLTGQASYWKYHYNTKLGKGTVEEYIEAYNEYVL